MNSAQAVDGSLVDNLRNLEHARNEGVLSREEYEKSRSTLVSNYASGTPKGKKKNAAPTQIVAVSTEELTEQTMEATLTISVMIPKGALPGQTIHAQCPDGRTVAVPLPLNVEEGQTIQVNVPAVTAVAAAAAPAGEALPSGASWDGMQPLAPPLMMSMDRSQETRPKYIGGTSGEHGTITLRDDGKAEWHDLCCHVKLSPPAGTRYVSVTTGRNGSALVRNDGAIDWKDLFCQFSFRSKSKQPYVSVSHYDGNLIALRADGVVEEHCCYQRCAEFKPGGKTKYVWAQSGPGGHLLVRDDGTARWECDSTNCCRVCCSGEIRKPPSGVRYISSSSGIHANLLLRDDGVVDKCYCYFCMQTMKPSNGTRYTSVSSHDAGAILIRSDGAAEKKFCCAKYIKPVKSEGRYVSAAIGKHGSIMILDDGTAEWIDQQGQGRHPFQPL